MVVARAKVLSLPEAVGVAIVADSVGPLWLPILAEQVQSGKEERPDCLVTGLTGLSLELPAPFGSAPT